MWRCIERNRLSHRSLQGALSTPRRETNDVLLGAHSSKGVADARGTDQKPANGVVQGEGAKSAIVCVDLKFAGASPALGWPPHSGWRSLAKACRCNLVAARAPSDRMASFAAVSQQRLVAHTGTKCAPSTAVACSGPQRLASRALLHAARPARQAASVRCQAASAEAEGACLLGCLEDEGGKGVGHCEARKREQATTLAAMPPSRQRVPGERVCSSTVSLARTHAILERRWLQARLGTCNNPVRAAATPWRLGAQISREQPSAWKAA